MTKDDFAHTLFLIKNLNLNNLKIIEENAQVYHSELAELYSANKNLDGESVLKTIEECNYLLQNSIKASKLVLHLNQIDINSQNEILALLQDKSLNFYLNKNFLTSYYEAFKTLRNKYTECKNELKTQEWLCTRTIDDKRDFYFKIADQSTWSWNRPASYIQSDKLLTNRIIKVSNKLF